MRNRHFPKYPNDTDYTTNSPSYYDDLARKQHLIKLLAEKIHGYDKELAKRFEQWDKNLEDFPEDVKLLLEQWLNDGTLDHIINETIFNWKADKSFVDSEIERLDQKDESIETKMKDHVYYVSDFGIVGDGVADDTTALQNALTTSFNDNALLDLSNYNFRITKPIQVLCDLHGSRATITVDGIINEPAILVGYKEDGSILRKKDINLPEIINKTRDWTTSVGVEVANLGESTVIFNYVTDCSVGVLLSAYGEGNAYNDFYLKHLHNNKINMKIAPTTNGWVNENNFYGGRFSYLSAMGSNVPGTKNIFITGENHPPNNNVFYKPSLEGETTEYVIDIEYGNHNMFISPRFESLNRKTRFGEKNEKEFSHSNVIMYGFNTYVLTVEETTNAKYNHVYDRDGFKIKGSGDGIIKLATRSGGTDGVINIYPSNKDIHNIDSSEYVLKSSQIGQHFKQSDDLFDRLTVESSGLINFGDGTERPTKYIRNWGDDIRTGGGNFEIVNGKWNTEHLKLGNYHLWVDNLGQLRIKSSKPTSDTDGNIVGSQGESQ